MAKTQFLCNKADYSDLEGPRENQKYNLKNESKSMRCNTYSYVEMKFVPVIPGTCTRFPGTPRGGGQTWNKYYIPGTST